MQWRKNTIKGRKMAEKVQCDRRTEPQMSQLNTDYRKVCQIFRSNNGIRADSKRFNFTKDTNETNTSCVATRNIQHDKTQEQRTQKAWIPRDANALVLLRIIKNSKLVNKLHHGWHFCFIFRPTGLFPPPGTKIR
jgi:hypothetical protein